VVEEGRQARLLISVVEEGRQARLETSAAMAPRVIVWVVLWPVGLCGGRAWCPRA